MIKIQPTFRSNPQIVSQFRDGSVLVKRTKEERINNAFAHATLGAGFTAFLAHVQTIEEMIAASKLNMDIEKFAKSKRLRTVLYTILGALTFGLMSWFWGDKKIVYKK